MLSKLFKLQERLTPYLRNQDYTFIAPVETTQFEEYVKIANRIHAYKAFSVSIHQVLSDNEVNRIALDHLPANTELRLYVITYSGSEIIGHLTIEQYCSKYKIDFEID